MLTVAFRFLFLPEHVSREFNVTFPLMIGALREQMCKSSRNLVGCMFAAYGHQKFLVFFDGRLIHRHGCVSSLRQNSDPKL